jgi:hypothetical protein
VTKDAGLDFSNLRDTGRGVAVGDFDGDGYPDIFIAGGDVGGPGQIHVQDQANGVAFFDYDNDGDLDLLIDNSRVGSPTLQRGSHIVTAGAVDLQAIRDDLKPNAKRSGKP